MSPEDEKKAQQELDRLRRKKKRGFEEKTLWDWLQLLGVPIFLAFATIGFGFVQFYLAGQQHDADQRIANQQHAIDQQSALDQQRADTLQKYIDNIQDLLLHDNLLKSSSFDTKNPYYDVAILAQARTQAALQGLDPDRKGRLVQFLYETQLIGFLNDNYLNDNFAETVSQILPLKSHNSIIDLSYTHANLSNANFKFAHLSGINFHFADLVRVNLNSADLIKADLSRATLSYTNLSDALLIGSNFSNAYLYQANLSGANLTQKQLDQVYSCKGATLPKGLTCKP